MAIIGLNNLWYSHLTEAVDGTPSYDGAKSFGKAVSANASITNNSAELFADDVLAESDTTFQSGTITLGVDDDRDKVFADLLGHNVTEEGEIIRNANDVAPYVGVARIIVKLVNNVRLYKVEVLYKVKFGEPSQDNNTKGESVEFSTPEIEGNIATLANGDWSDAKTFATKAEALAFIQATFASSEPTTYRVNYDVNGGTGSIAAETVTAGESTTLASASEVTAPEGTEFGGWALTSTASEAAYQAGNTFTPTHDTTFYAVWTPTT